MWHVSLSVTKFEVAVDGPWRSDITRWAQAERPDADWGEERLDADWRDLQAASLPAVTKHRLAVSRTPLQPRGGTKPTPFAGPSHPDCARCPGSPSSGHRRGRCRAPVRSTAREDTSIRGCAPAAGDSLRIV